MGFSQIIVVVILVYFTVYLIGLFNKNKRKYIKTSNESLDKLRKIPKKTIEEQKEFLKIRYPTSNKKFKFKWAMIPGILWAMFLYTIIFIAYNSGINYIGWDVKFWQAILFTMIFPYVFNITMRKFGGFQKKSDISIFFR